MDLLRSDAGIGECAGEDLAWATSARAGRPLCAADRTASATSVIAPVRNACRTDRRRTLVLLARSPNPPPPDRDEPRPGDWAARWQTGSGRASAWPVLTVISEPGSLAGKFGLVAACISMPPSLTGRPKAGANPASPPTPSPDQRSRSATAAGLPFSWKLHEPTQPRRPGASMNQAARQARLWSAMSLLDQMFASLRAAWGAEEPK